MDSASSKYRVIVLTLLVFENRSITESTSTLSRNFENQTRSTFIESEFGLIIEYQPENIPSASSLDSLRLTVSLSIPMSEATWRMDDTIVGKGSNSDLPPRRSFRKILISIASNLSNPLQR